MTKRHFHLLYSVFLLRVVDLELLSADGDTTKLLGQFAALFASVSFALTVLFVIASGAFGNQEFLWTMEHFLIATSMVVIGLFTVLNWDSTFPDRRDILVLSPLPIPQRTILLAKLAAMAAALGLSIVALNVFSGLVWPLIFSPSDSGLVGAMRSLVAYWVTVMMAATFVVCSVLIVQGASAQLLPRQIYLRWSALLQVTAFVLFLGVYILEPSLESIPALSAPQNQRLLACLPTYWFLGLFQQLNGSMRSPFASLAERAWLAFAVAVVGAAATLLLSYFRTIRKIVEQPDILPGSRRSNWPLRFGNSLEHAVTIFCLRSLIRSRQHRVILSFYFGIGLAIVLAYLNLALGAEFSLQRSATRLVNPAWIAASYLLLCVAVAGIRVASSMPIDLGANWVFRVTQSTAPYSYIAAVRRAYILLAVVPVLTCNGIAFLAIWPWLLAVKHLLALWLVGMILVELCLYRFRKVPFTCAYLPGKRSLQPVYWAVTLLLLPLLIPGARLEMNALTRPFWYTVMIFCLGIVLAFARRMTRAAAESAEMLQFEENSPPALLALNLTRY